MLLCWQLKQVLLDGQLLRNILYNLLSNAIMYSPERARILVNLRCDPGRLAIIVKDEG